MIYNHVNDFLKMKVGHKKYQEIDESLDDKTINKTREITWSLLIYFPHGFCLWLFWLMT